MNNPHSSQKSGLQWATGFDTAFALIEGHPPAGLFFWLLALSMPGFVAQDLSARCRLLSVREITMIERHVARCPRFAPHIQQIQLLSRSAFGALTWVQDILSPPPVAFFPPLLRDPFGLISTV